MCIKDGIESPPKSGPHNIQFVKRTVSSSSRRRIRDPTQVSI